MPPSIPLLLLCIISVSVESQVYDLKLLDLSKYPLAQCLDGSPGGYYTGPTGGNVSTWIVHLQGGGWCGGSDDCAARAGTHYGSSLSWTSGSCPDSNNMACWADNPTGLPAGLGSSNSSISPLFHDAKHIWVPYCDGGSFSGTRIAPVPYNSSFSLTYRGRFILDAVLEELAAVENLAEAREFLLKGCSAGGQAVYLHADYVGERLRSLAPNLTLYAAAPGAGLFLNTSFYGSNNGSSFASSYQWIYDEQEAAVNSACTEARTPADSWQCFLSPLAIHYVLTPLFVSNSMVDSCAALFIMNLGCDARVPSGLPFSCNASQLAYLSGYRAAMLGVLQPLLARRPDHGAFLQACWTHIVEDDDISWASTRVQGQTQEETFAAWYTARREGAAAGGALSTSTGGAATVVFDGEWGSNPTCSNWGTCY